MAAASLMRCPTSLGCIGFGQPGKALYIGMSIKLQQRVRSHFSGTTASRKRQILLREMRSLKHELAGSEWMAAVMEDVRIEPMATPQPRPKTAPRLPHGGVLPRRQGRSRLAMRTQAGARDAVRTIQRPVPARGCMSRWRPDLNPEWLGLGAWSSAEPVPQEVHEANFEAAMATWRDVASGWFMSRDEPPTSAASLPWWKATSVAMGLWRPMTSMTTCAPQTAKAACTN